MNESISQIETKYMLCKLIYNSVENKLWGGTCYFGLLILESDCVYNGKKLYVYSKDLW